MRFWVTYDGNGSKPGGQAQQVRLTANDEIFTVDELLNIAKELKKEDMDCGICDTYFYIWDCETGMHYTADEFKELVPMLSEIDTSYCAHSDMTFITETTFDWSGDPVSVEVVGFYFGEPDADSTLKYKGSLKARLS